MYKPLCTTEIIFSGKEELENRLLSLEVKNIAIIIDELSVERWNLHIFLGNMQKKYNLIWINTLITYPNQKSIYDALFQIGREKPDVVIAFGGGSAIDLAKGISAFYNKDKIPSVSEITVNIKDKSYQNNNDFIDIIAVPSTAGTGSELTQWATVWDIDKDSKFSIDAPGLKPKTAFIVSELTLTLPAKLTLSTGLDALSHAVEAYWSKHTSPIVQDIAYRAIQLMIENLKKVLDNPSDNALREKMCRASVLAGLAFSQTRTTACHSISYPITMLFGVSHGLAAALTLAEVAKINKGHFPGSENLFQLFESEGGIQQWLDKTCKGILSLRLSTFNIKEKDIEILAEKSFTGGRMDNNPVDLTKNDVRTILYNLL